MPESSVEPKLLPPSLRRKMNQFNNLRSDEQTEPPRERNSQPPTYHFKHRNYLPKSIPVVSSIMGILNYHAINNVNFEVYPSDFPVESNH